jgi:hypothetical protein
MTLTTPDRTDALAERLFGATSARSSCSRSTSAPSTASTTP